MKASDNRQFSSFLSLVLTLAGVLLILAFLVNCLFLFVPSDQPKELGSLEGARWQVALISQIVDRGIVPLMGLVLISTGLWVEGLFGVNSSRSKAQQNIGLAAFLFASLLGLIFIIFIPLHLNNAYHAHQKTLEQLKQEAGQAENQLNGQLATRLAQERSQIDVLLKNDQILQQAISSGQIKPQEAALLQQFKSDPKAFENFINKKAAEFRTQIQSEIRTKQQQSERQSQTQYVRSGLQTSLISLLLAIGYITIGWTGLKNLGVQRTVRRKSSVQKPLS